MAGMETSIVIGSPIETVSQFFLNPKDSAPKMDPRGGGLVLISPDGPPGPGTTFVFRQQVFGKTRETKSHLTAVEPSKRIAFTAEIGPLRPSCALTFEPLPSGTRVTFSGDSHPPGALKLATRLIDRMGQRNWTQRFARAKAVLESADG